MEEREEERKRRGGQAAPADPDRAREVQSLRLAKSNLERQAAATTHPVRKQQIQMAIAEIDRRLGKSEVRSQK